MRSTYQHLSQVISPVNKARGHVKKPAPFVGISVEKLGKLSTKSGIIGTFT